MIDIFLDMGHVALRTVISVIVLFIMSKLVGVRQIAQLTFYDYIVGITIGSIAAMAIEENIPIQNIIISMIVFCGFTVLTAFITNKNLTCRRIFTGKPRVLIFHGRIIEKNLAKDNYDVNDLLSECRQKGFFNIDDIDCAILETNGSISILPKADKRPLTPSDMSIIVPKEDLQYDLILDGEVMRKNLKAFGKDEQWLKKQLANQGIDSLKNILLAVGNVDNKLFIFKTDEIINDENIFI